MKIITLKRAGTVFALLAFCSLALPFYHTTLRGDWNGTEVVLTGFDFAGISPWGGFLILLPILLLATIYSRLSYTLKTVFSMALYGGSAVCLYYACNDAYRWMMEVKGDGYIRQPVAAVLYALLFFAALISFHLHGNRNAE